MTELETIILTMIKQGDMLEVADEGRCTDSQVFQLGLMLGSRIVAVPVGTALHEAVTGGKVSTHRADALLALMQQLPERERGCRG